MTNPKDQILGKPNQELLNIINSAEQELAKRKMESAIEGKVIIKIDDFMNPIVKPLASGLSLDIERISHFAEDGIAIYSVFNFDTGMEFKQRAGMIINLFGKDSLTKLKFMAKKLGDVISLNHFGESFRIKFIHLELPISKCDLEEWAKKLGRKPEEILLGTPKQYYRPDPVIKENEDEIKVLLRKKLELEIRDKEIELAEREFKLEEKKNKESR
jgi:hypothetical protein